MNSRQIQVRILFIVVLILIAFMADLALGSVNIPTTELWSHLIGKGENTSWHYILLEFRFPKAVLALLTGGGLAVAGVMMQTLFRNPLAGPFVLGISSGASLGVALYVMAIPLFGATFLTGYLAGDVGSAIAAIAGSLIIMFLVVSLSIHVKGAASLLIIGIMFGNLTGAVVSILQYFSDPDKVQSFLVWTFGSLAGTGWQQLKLIAPVVLLGIVVAFVLQKRLNALLLGEQYAQALGIRIQRTRQIIIISTCLIAGSLTAFTGPIAFIGIAVPHVARMVFKSNNHSVLLPTSALIGMLLMLICDVVSQVPGSTITLPINSICALVGAPVVITVILRRRSGGGI